MWDVFPRMRPRVGRGRRAAVNIVVCFRWGGFFCPCCFFHVFFFFVSTGPAASMRAPCLIYLSTRTGVRTGAIFFLSVCLFVTFVVLLSARAVRGGFPQVRDLQKRVSIANAWDVFRRTPSRGG